MLAGCVFVEPEKVAAMAVPEAPFEQGLFNGYLELSKSRSLQGDRLASSFFASKARTVARGEAIPPEVFETWRLQDDQRNMLIVARARLTSSIAEMDDDDGAEFGARAQVMFDCWLERQEVSGEKDVIDTCRIPFWQAMEKWEDSLAQ